MTFLKKTNLSEPCYTAYSWGPIPAGHIVTELLEWCYPTRQRSNNLERKAIHHRVLIRVCQASNDDEVSAL